MVFGKLKRWRAKSVTGSEAFCRDGETASEPSSKAASGPAQGAAPRVDLQADSAAPGGLKRAPHKSEATGKPKRSFFKLGKKKSVAQTGSGQNSDKSKSKATQESVKAATLTRAAHDLGGPAAQASTELSVPTPPPPTPAQSQPLSAADESLPGDEGGDGSRGGKQQAEAPQRKRVAIAAENADVVGDIKIPHFPKDEAMVKFLEAAVEANLLFEMLSKATRKAIFDSMTPCTVAAGTEVITQGDEGTRFYVLEKGSCDVLLHKEEWGPLSRKVLTYGPGNCFGELALLYSALRAATVRSTSECRLWVMERNVYAHIKHAASKKLAAEKHALVAAAPMLSILSQEHRELVAEALEVEEFEAGEAIYKQGTAGDSFYIIKQGTVVISKVQGSSIEVLERLSQRSYFGERALVMTDTRQADATAESYVVCYTLRRQAFNKLLGPIEEVWKLEALRKVPILFNLPEAKLQDLAKRMQTLRVPAEQVIFKTGDPGDVFYVIEEGSFVIYSDGGEELARVGKGSCFGELALLRQEGRLSVRAANVRAVTDGTLLTLTREGFDSLLGSLADIRHMWRFEALRMVPLLAGLTSAQRSQLCPAMKPVRIPAGRTIVTIDRPATFAIIEAGTCSVLGEKGQEIAKLGPTMYMGESALQGMEPSLTSIEAITTVDLLVLQRSDVVRILGPNFGQTSKSSLPAAKQRLQLADLVTVARLGAGAFGLVSLVKYGSNYYALKQMYKSQIVQMGLQDHVKREKQIMSECSCPFIVNLVSSFKDAHCLYMLLEAVMGGELFSYLQSRPRPLSEDHARFYAASVVLGLEYMQQRNLMWRDLKPENLLIDTRGYVKMADFGFAKRMPPGQKSYTLCGTPEYLAPELVTQSGHTRAVDWWAVGVLIYEMVAGTPPFYHEDRVAMFKNICHIKYSMPSHFSKELKDLVRRMLVLLPAQRLGATKNGAADVKEHAWFNGFDWAAFSQRSMAAPYVPKVKSPEDASNFSEPAADAGRDAQAQRYHSTGIFKDF